MSYMLVVVACLIDPNSAVTCGPFMTMSNLNKEQCDTMKANLAKEFGDVNYLYTCLPVEAPTPENQL